MQLAAPVAAHRQQRQIVVALEPVLPDLGQEGVDEAGPLRHQRGDIFASPEARRQRVVRTADAASQVLRIEPRRGRGHAKFSSARSVSTSQPLSVTRMVCSHCAESL